MNTLTRPIKERFPDQKYSIDRLVAQDPEFLSLCEDYDACINALKYWSQSKAPEAEEMISEFSTIAQELEEEVIEALIGLNRR